VLVTILMVASCCLIPAGLKIICEFQLVLSSHMTLGHCIRSLPKLECMWSNDTVVIESYDPFFPGWSHSAKPVLSLHGRKWPNLPSMALHNLWTARRKVEVQPWTAKAKTRKSYIQKPQFDKYNHRKTEWRSGGVHGPSPRGQRIETILCCHFFVSFFQWTTSYLQIESGSRGNTEVS